MKIKKVFFVSFNRGFVMSSFILSDIGYSAGKAKPQEGLPSLAELVKKENPAVVNISTTQIIKPRKKESLKSAALTAKAPMIKILGTFGMIFWASFQRISKHRASAQALL